MFMVMRIRDAEQVRLGLFYNLYWRKNDQSEMHARCDELPQ
jgi:hypothetical protein